MVSGRSLKFLNSLSLFFFIFYAISPLCYILSGSGNVPHTVSMFSNNARPFYWELVFSKLAAVDDDKNSNSAIKILFRKKQATIPDSSDFRTGPSRDNASITGAHLAHSFCSLRSSRVYLSSAKCLGGFLFSYSGLSPPFQT